MKIGHVCQWWNNGSSDPATLYIDRRKIEGGWPRELAVHKNNGETRRIVHLPHGTRDPNNMETDAIAYAKQNPSLALATNEAELVACFLMQWEIDRIPTDFYLGGPRGSELLMAAWNKSNKGAWSQRIDSVFRPVLKMRDRGMDVGIVIDGAAAQPAGGPDEAVIARAKKHGLRRAVEAIPEHDWCNKPDIGVVAFNSYWKMADPSVNLGSRCIRYDKLLGDITIIAVESDTNEEVIAHLAAGRNVAVLGPRPYASELRARAAEIAGGS